LESSPKAVDFKNAEIRFEKVGANQTPRSKFQIKLEDACEDEDESDHENNNLMNDNQSI